MTDREDCERAALDIYITTLLTPAADTYASRADIKGQISAVLAVGVAAADS